MKFTFIDLFAGIGGFHQAAKELGGECVFASEIDKHACKTYEANHGIKPHGDITKIDAKDIPHHDILFAGFPCQSFSVAGKRLGFEDTRGTLFFEIVRILKEKQPKMFLLENVKGLKSHDNGKTLAIILDTLKSLDYNVHCNILNTKDYGIPQNRERIFFVGFKEPQPFQFPWKHAPITLSQFFGGNWAKDIAHTVRKGGRGSGIDDKHNWDSYIYSDLRNGKNTIHSWDIVETTDREKLICQLILQLRRRKQYTRSNKDGAPLMFPILKGFMADLEMSELDELVKKGILKEIQPYSYDFKNSRNMRGINGIYRIFSKDSIFPTLTATKQLDFIHDNSSIRKLTIQECALLQGFPADFIIPVSDTQAYKQFGNAVSVNVVRAILQQIFSVYFF